MKDGYTNEDLLLVWLAACAGLDERAKNEIAQVCARGISAKHLEKICGAVIQTGTNRVYKDGCAAIRQEAEGYLLRLSGAGGFAVTLAGTDYPESLRAIPDPPLALFCAGKRELLNGRKFCIVGSRMLPAWAQAAGKKISSELSERFAVVTGIAEGGDRAAIDGAVTSGKLICVLPCGLDVDYPASHASLKREIAKRGLLVSEVPLGVRAQKFSFHARNRILAGLSEGVLVLAAGERSGALITADRALAYGREVFALPHNAGAAQGAGCNELIKQGAYLCTDAGDIFAAFGMERAQRPAVQLTPQEETLLAELRLAGEAHAAVLAGRAGIPVWEAQAALASLELKGLAVRAGGNQYAALKA